MEASKRVVFVSLRGKEDGRQRTRRKRALGCVPIPAVSPEPRRVSPTPTGLSFFPPLLPGSQTKSFPTPDRPRRVPVARPFVPARPGHIARALADRR